MTQHPPNSGVPGYAVVPSEQYRTVQKAHDDLPEEGGGIWLRDTVEESDITLEKPVKLVGQGSGHDGTTGATIDTSGGDGIHIVSEGITLQDIHVAGNRTGGYGIKLGGEDPSAFSGKTTLQNVGIKKKGGHGILVDGGQLNNKFDVSVWNCAGDGWHFQGDWFNEHTFERMVAYGCDGDGVHIEQSMDPDNPDNRRSRFNGNSIHQFWMEHNEGWGLYVEDDVRMEGNHISGYGIEHNQGEGPNKVIRVKNLRSPPWRGGASGNLLHLRNLIYGTVELDREEFETFIVPNIATGED